VGILGFDVIMRMDSALFLSAGGYHHHLAFNTWESKGGTPPPVGATGLYHVAIKYPTRASLGDALIRLVDAGCPLEGVNDHGTHEALYLRDPDENGLELCWDRPEQDWPKDEEGHMVISSSQLDIQGLFDEGKTYTRAN
jgi:catechol 2,3-dioxygenase